MLLIPCPWCGPRNETEFRPGALSRPRRPERPADVGDAAWADYLFMRTNPRGRLRERWFHVHGCRRWFDVERDTVTHAVHGSALPGQAIANGPLGIQAGGNQSGGDGRE